MNDVFVGTDVVDLGRPRTENRHVDPRFMERVFAPEERNVIDGSADPAVEVWALWAAKEAAYKVASKLLSGPPTFEHRAFVVAWGLSQGSRRQGAVTFRDMTIPVEVSLHPQAVHAVAASMAAPSGLRSSLEPLGEPAGHPAPHFTPREADAIHSPASAAVRVSARKALAEVLSCEESRVEIVCDAGVTGRRPPRVLVDGEPASVEVSLSHDGDWIAWAVLPQKPLGR